MPSADGELLCPRCGRPHPSDERFCESCGMPLVLAGARGEEPRTEAHAEARKIHPRYATGELRRVTVVPNLAEAELIKGVLLEQGIPSMIRRTAGFDVPDFLAAGPRDVLVPAGGAEAARELLGEVERAAGGEAGGDDPADVAFGRGYGFKLAAWMLVAVLAFGAIAGLLFVLVR